MIDLWFFFWIGDFKKGVNFFKICCVQCYIFEVGGGNKIGFVFYGFFGCKFGIVEGYVYIDVNKQKGVVWDDQIFVCFL